MSLLETILLCALGALMSFLVVKWLFTKDTEIESRRRAAAQLAAKLQSFGLAKVPEFLIDYSVGDYSGMTHKLAELCRLFLDGEEAVEKEFAAVFDKCLTAKLKTDSGRAFIAAKLTDATKPADPSIVQDAPVAGTV